MLTDHLLAHSLEVLSGQSSESSASHAFSSPKKSWGTP
jgi:hypothetical protein